MSLRNTIEVKVRKGQSVDIALRILKRRMYREGIIEEVKSRNHFVPPSEERRVAEKERRYLSRIIQSYERLEHGEITVQEFEELGFGKPYLDRRARKKHRY